MLKKNARVKFIKTYFTCTKKLQGQHFYHRIEYQELSEDPTEVTAVLTALTTPPSVRSAMFSGLQPNTRYQVV